MKFELDRLTEYSRKSVIAELQRVAAEIPQKFMTIAEFEKHARMSMQPVTKYLGSWPRALQQAGLGRRLKRTSRYKTNETLLAELRSVARKIKSRTVTVEDLLRFKIHPNVLRRRFGSWKKSLCAAGLKLSRSGVRRTDEECFANLKRVWIHLGRPPRCNDLASPPSTISQKVYFSRFGSWRKTLEIFVNRMNGKTFCPATNINKKPSSKLQFRRNISIGTRFWVLQRDCFRCRLCGNSPAVDPRCRLHVDHIKPFSLGGKTRADNLRTLCAKCNIGRSNRYRN